MNPAALFRHYVGRMSAPARWYLAGLGMVSLCLLAAHFSVQEHVQRNMRQAVRGWLAQGGGSVNNVRYHLLRGALTLEGVHWVDTADPHLSMDVDRVSILTSSRAMASPRPSFLLLSLEHPVLTLPRSSLLGWLHGDAGSALNALSGLSGHARIVVVHNMDLRLLPDVSGKARVARLLQQVDGAVARSGIRLDGMLETGIFHLGARPAATGLTGRLDVRGVPLAALRTLIGGAAQSPEVVASGDLALSGNWKQRDVGLHGRLVLQDDKAESAVDIHAGWSRVGSNLDMQCNNVLLTGLPIDWPLFAGRRLTAGRLSGLLHLDRSRDATGWRIGMDGHVTGLVLSSTKRPSWSIGGVQLRRAMLLPASGKLSAAQMQLSDADLPLDVSALPSGEATGPTPQIDSLVVQHIRPRLRFADGAELALPELAGTGKMGKAGHISLSTQHDQANSTGPEAGEVWKLVVNGDVYADWRAKVSAAHVPLVRLRQLLPDLTLPGQQGVPEYGGSAGFSLNLSPSTAGLQVSGNAVLQDVSMTQGGDQLTAGRIEVDIADAVSGGMRSLSRVDIGDWQYQMALHPLARLVQDVTPPPSAAGGDNPSDKPAVAIPADVGPAGKAGPAWNVDEITAHNGRISLGQPNALIADDLQLAVHHLSVGKMAAFTLGGHLGGGVLRGQGDMQLQPAFRMSAKARVYHALPFAFNDWMQLSGMPRFMRGRLDVDLRITSAHHVAQSSYKGRLRLHLDQGVLEDGSDPDDPMLQRAGYTARELLARLAPARQARLTIPFSGDWQGETLGDTLGDATLVALKQAAAKALVKPQPPEPPAVTVTRLRLQGKLGFSLNERLRMRRLARKLWHDKKLIVELTPKLGNGPLDAELVERMRYTQHVVERYLQHLGIPARRIYPVWPQASQPHGDAPGLLLRARHS